LRSQFSQAEYPHKTQDFTNNISAMPSKIHTDTLSSHASADSRTPMKNDTVEGVMMKKGRINTFIRQLVARKQGIKQPAIRGVYHIYSDSSTHKDSLTTAPPSSTSGYHQSSQRTIGTQCNSVDTENTAAIWTPSNSLDHHKDAPKIVRRPQYEKKYNEDDDDKLLRKIIYESRKLPQSDGRCPGKSLFSMHVGINSERLKRFVPPLLRNPKLDEIAREHAARMAQCKDVHHVRDPVSLYDRIHRDDDENVDHDDDTDNSAFVGRTNDPSIPLVADESCNRLGENISCGQNLKEIHQAMIASASQQNNMLDRRFLAMGVGTAKASDGTLYVCQIFTG
jgi:uncharacterized protein YkwD